MLVIQRSLRKSAPLVESCERPNQQSRRCLTCVSKTKIPPDEERGSEAKDISFKKETGAIYLQGKPIRLQQRVSSNKQLSYQICSDQATYANKANHQRYSAGGREKDWNKPSNYDVKKRVASRNASNNEENQKIVQQKRKQKVRTPLLMSNMNLPNDTLAALMSKETLQAHTSREDAPATLQRLLSTRTHQSATAASKCTVKQRRPSDGSAAGHHGASEKAAYLQDSYDYLFQRHYQNLNNVIHQNQEASDASQVTQKHKKTVDIHQNCCRGGACNKEEQINIDSLSERSYSTETDQRNPLKPENTRATHPYLTKPDTRFVLRNQVGVVDSSLQEDINTNLHSLTTLIGDSVSCRASGDNVPKYQSPVSSGNFNVSASNSAMPGQHLGGSLEEETRCPLSRSSEDRKRNGGFICINVSDQFQDIHLEEAEPTINKPVITLNHVSENFSSERQEVLVIRSYSRSPSPLLEVPRATDIRQESSRPPLQ